MWHKSSVVLCSILLWDRLPTVSLLFCTLVGPWFFRIREPVLVYDSLPSFNTLLCDLNCLSAVNSSDSIDWIQWTLNFFERSHRTLCICRFVSKFCFPLRTFSFCELWVYNFSQLGIKSKLWTAIPIGRWALLQTSRICWTINRRVTLIKTP